MSDTSGAMEAIGSRVGVIAYEKDFTIYLIGYGIRVEDEIPIGAGGLANILIEGGLKNPTILLDSGEKVYGCECWWGPEEYVKIYCESPRKKVVLMSLEELRGRSARPN